MVYTNQVLMEKDQADSKEFWTKTSLQEQVIYHKDIDFQVEEEQLVIFDEADEYIYGQTQRFLDFLGTNKTICLTATCGGSSPTEKFILEYIGLQQFENAVAKKISNHIHVQFDQIDIGDNNTAICTWLS